MDLATRFSTPATHAGHDGAHGMTGGCMTVLTERFARAVDYASSSHLAGVRFPEEGICDSGSA
jgi:hypothetical protein